MIQKSIPTLLIFLLYAFIGGSLIHFGAGPYSIVLVVIAVYLSNLGIAKFRHGSLSISSFRGWLGISVLEAAFLALFPFWWLTPNGQELVRDLTGQTDYLYLFVVATGVAGYTVIFHLLPLNWLFGEIEGEPYDDWIMFPPKPPTSFAAQLSPSRRKQELLTNDLSGTQCILGGIYHCSLPSSPNAHFEYDNNEDDEHSVGIKLFEQSETGIVEDSQISINVSSEADSLDPIVDAVLAKETVTTEDIESLRPKVVEWFETNLARELGKNDLEDAQIEMDIHTVSVQEVQQRNIFSLKLSVHMQQGEESIPDFSEPSEPSKEDQKSVGEDLVLDFEGYTVGFSNEKGLMPSLNIFLVKSRRGDDFLSLAENLIRGISVQDFGFLGQIPLFQGEFLSRPKSS